jgi:Major Facilitator Superfamily
MADSSENGGHLKSEASPLVKKGLYGLDALEAIDDGDQRVSCTPKSLTVSNSDTPSPSSFYKRLDPPRFRIFLVILACAQNSLVGGLIYGWASVIPLFTAPLDEGGADLTLTDCTIIFSRASCAGMVSTLLLGHILDRAGPRVCSVVAHSLIAAGSLMFAVAPYLPLPPWNPNSFDRIAAATCFLALGGPGIQVSIIHVANLFPKQRFLMLSIINGTISFSFAVLACFDIMWVNYGIGYQSLFGCFSVLVLISLILSATLWPDAAYEEVLENDSFDFLEPSMHGPTPEDSYLAGITSHSHLLHEAPLDAYLRTLAVGVGHEDREDCPDADHYFRPSVRVSRQISFIASKKAMEQGELELIHPKDRPFAQQLRHGLYLRNFAVFNVLCFFANFYVGAITAEVSASLQ